MPGTPATPASAAPVERRRRRKLPMIERPKSAPIYPGMVDFRMISETGNNVHDVCDFSQNGTGSMKTVIHISDPSQQQARLVKFLKNNPTIWITNMHYVRYGSNVDRTPCMSPAVSHSNISFPGGEVTTFRGDKINTEYR